MWALPYCGVKACSVMRVKQIVPFSIFALSILGARHGPAQDVTNSNETPQILLRETLKGGVYIFPEALFIGQLTIKNGCVQLIGKGQTESITPTWPDYVKLMRDEAGYVIKVKNKTLEFGKTYHFGGAGDILKTDSPIANQCGSKSIWFVGDVDG